MEELACLNRATVDTIPISTCAVSTDPVNTVHALGPACYITTQVGSQLIRVPREGIDFTNLFRSEGTYYELHKLWGFAYSTAHFGDMMNFHKNPNAEIVNRVIESDSVMFTTPDEAIIEDAKDQLVEYHGEMNRKQREKHTERLNGIVARANVRSVKFSNPHILAWVYTVVQTYPDLIPYIENAVYVERAYKYIEGSYHLSIASACNFPSIRIQNSDLADDKEKIARGLVTKIDRWAIKSRDVIFTLLFRYGASGDKCYLDQCKNISLYDILPISDIIMDHIGMYFEDTEDQIAWTKKMKDSMSMRVNEYFAGRKVTSRRWLGKMAIHLKAIGEKMIADGLITTKQEPAKKVYDD